MGFLEATPRSQDYFLVLVRRCGVYTRPICDCPRLEFSLEYVSHRSGKKRTKICT